MTRDDIIRMAREAGWNGVYSNPLMSIRMQEEDFMRFAALVAAAEREACARICESLTDWPPNATLYMVADAIRNRGDVNATAR